MFKDNLLSIEQAALYVGVSRRCIRNMTERKYNRLRSHQKGRGSPNLYSKSALDKAGPELKQMQEKIDSAIPDGYISRAMIEEDHGISLHQFRKMSATGIIKPSMMKANKIMYSREEYEAAKPKIIDWIKKNRSKHKRDTNQKDSDRNPSAHGSPEFDEKKSVSVEFLTPREVARLLNVAYLTINRAINMGKLKAYRFGEGRSFRIRRSDFESYLASMEYHPE